MKRMVIELYEDSTFAGFGCAALVIILVIMSSTQMFIEGDNAKWKALPGSIYLLYWFILLT